MDDPKKKPTQAVQDDFVEDDFQPDADTTAVQTQAQPQEEPGFFSKVNAQVSPRFQAPGAHLNKSLSYLAQGDIPAGAVGIANAFMGLPDAALSLTNFIPGVGPMIDRGVSTGLGALASPGVNAWNATIPRMRAWMDENWPDRPRPFSAAAGEEANVLGQNLSGAASGMALGEIAGGAAGGLNQLRAPIADRLSQASFKVPPTVKAAERNRILKTTQQHGITPNEAGVAKLNGIIDDMVQIQKSLEDAARSSAKGANTRGVLQSLDEVYAKWRKSDLPQEFLSVLRDYRRSVLQQRGKKLTMDDMIGLKQNLQEQLTNVFERQAKLTPGLKETLLQQAKHAVERDLRGRLENQIPGYGDINANISDAMRAKPYVERASNRIHNYDAVSAVKDATGAALGATVGGQFGEGAIGAALGLLLERAALNPVNWARAANAIAPAGAVPSIGSTAARGARMGAGAGAAGAAADATWTRHPAGFEYQILPEDQ